MFDARCPQVLLSPNDVAPGDYQLCWNNVYIGDLTVNGPFYRTDHECVLTESCMLLRDEELQGSYKLLQKSAIPFFDLENSGAGRLPLPLIYETISSVIHVAEQSHCAYKGRYKGIISQKTLAHLGAYGTLSCQELGGVNPARVFNRVGSSAISFVGVGQGYLAEGDVSFSCSPPQCSWRPNAACEKAHPNAHAPEVLSDRSTSGALAFGSSTSSAPVSAAARLRTVLATLPCKPCVPAAEVVCSQKALDHLLGNYTESDMIAAYLWYPDKHVMSTTVGTGNS